LITFTPQIETIFKNELQSFFSEWGQKQWSKNSKTEVEAVAVMLNWALYGAAMHWMQNKMTQPEDYVK